MLFIIWATQLLHLQQAALVLTASRQFHTLQEEEERQQLIKNLLSKTASRSTAAGKRQANGTSTYVLSCSLL